MMAEKTSTFRRQRVVGDDCFISMLRASDHKKLTRLSR